MNKFDTIYTTSKAQIEVPVAVARLSPRGAGFGYTQDGQGVIVPISIMRHCNIGENSVRIMRLTTNPKDTPTTPWMAFWASKSEFVKPEPAKAEDQPDPSSIKADILIHLRKCEVAYQTTSEIASAIGAGVIEARNVLMAMHRDGQVARADVFAKPDQLRASGTIWALTANDILG